MMGGADLGAMLQGMSGPDAQVGGCVGGDVSANQRMHGGKAATQGMACPRSVTCVYGSLG
jgi:hypothetical protein